MVISFSRISPENFRLFDPGWSVQDLSNPASHMNTSIFFIKETVDFENRAISVDRPHMKRPIIVFFNSARGGGALF